jgi:hypothetical protein
MRASVGDRIIVASNRLDHPLRDGKIVECRNVDGSPPYVVEWSDTGQTGFFFPGPDAHVQHFADQLTAQQQVEAQPRLDAQPTADVQPRRHVKSWRVEVSLFESGEDTTAHAVLVAEVPGIDAKGRAYRHPHDPDVPEIGDEVAVARALRRLSDRLLGVAADDIATLEGHPVVLHQ